MKSLSKQSILNHAVTTVLARKLQSRSISTDLSVNQTNAAHQFSQTL